MSTYSVDYRSGCSLYYFGRSVTVVTLHNLLAFFMGRGSSGKVLPFNRLIESTAMTTKNDRLSFLEEMKDVRRLRKPNRAEITIPRELTPGHLERQRAAVEKPLKD